MKKSVILRPVSQKAYARFVERIILVVTDKYKCKAMLTALDSYLDGDRANYGRNLTPDCVMVFEMLRFEIDLAIARSARARTRNRSRRTPAGTDKRDAAKLSADNSFKTTAANGNHVTGLRTEDDDSIEITTRVSRRIRRAVNRLARTKTRWRKLG